MRTIDGSLGEGGGQIIRSSLALSVVTGTPIHLTNIRAGRAKPGLKRQHVTCVQAAADICGGSAEDAEMNASEFTFTPGAVRGGEYHFQVGTAGSATLVAQTVLPALMLADEPSTVTFEGGTHNPWAPPFDFLKHCFLPQLAKCGVNVTATLDAYGFYPAGGGRFTLQIEPCQQLSGFDLLERGGKAEPTVSAVVAGLPGSIGQRECDTIRRKMAWPEKCTRVIEAEKSIGAGNVVMIQLASSNVTELVIGIGKIGVKAEHVARGALREAKRYIASQVPVGEYLADQLLMPLGLAAHQGQTSSFRTGPLSLHSQTHIDVLKMFLDIEIEVCEDDESGSLVVKLLPATSIDC
ncbi:MAG: RNA 3'-terminal phosphate cyclase [Pirellulaceae bacterium]